DTMIGITDEHGVSATISLALTYNSVDNLVSVINNTIEATPEASVSAVVTVRAYNSNGILGFRSTESGQRSNFTISDAGGSQTVVSRLNVMPTTTTNGTGGVAASPFFERDSSFSINGFFIGNDSAAGTISFRVADQDGNIYTAVITSAATISVGDTFINALSFVDILNSGLATARVNAQATLTSGNQLRFLSSSSGKDVWIASAPTYKNLNSNLGLSSGSRYGSGDGSFRIHIANNQPQYQIGTDQGQFMQIGFQDMSSDALGISNLDLTTTKGAQEAITTINTAIDRVSSERSKLGAFQNRLEHTVNNLRTTYSNLTASESRIRDTDMALEMVEFTRNQIISQSGTAMMAQANLIPQGVLQLLR
ncbi:hypothetical protein HYY75_07430, partial [bacterium]|nr:hypothetical protein [bacterium]